MRQVRIMLPNASCNLRCKYCLNTNRIKGLPVEINFDKLFSRLDLIDFEVIGIWGGEPLYNPNLEKLLRGLREHYSDKEIHILSNGTLLNDYFVQLFNELNVYYGISHDGKQQYLRCKDFLKEKQYIELLKKLNHFTGFNCVISRDNCNMVDTYNYLCDIASDIQSDWQVTFELFELTDENLLDYMPSIEQYSVLFKNYKDILKLAINGEQHLKAYSSRWKNRNNAPKIWRCGAGTRLTVDCEGNSYLCQVLADRGSNNKPVPHIPLMCAGCKYINFCRGVCPLIPDRLRQKVCMCYHLYYDALRALDLESR